MRERFIYRPTGGAGGRRGGQKGKRPGERELRATATEIKNLSDLIIRRITVRLPAKEILSAAQELQKYSELPKVSWLAKQELIRGYNFRRRLKVAPEEKREHEWLLREMEKLPTIRRHLRAKKRE